MFPAATIIMLETSTIDVDVDPPALLEDSKCPKTIFCILKKIKKLRVFDIYLYSDVGKKL
jgi:hypothetical protein